MVDVATHFYRLAFQLITDTSQVAMQFLFHGWLDEWLPVFSTKYQVDIILH